MRLVLFLLAWQMCFAASAHAQLKPVLPKQAPTASDALGSPGIDAGDYVYFSGQGPRLRDGNIPTNFADQVRQCLENVRTVVEAAGLTMDHVVYVQVYLEDINQYGTLNKVFTDFFRVCRPRVRSWALPDSRNLPCKSLRSRCGISPENNPSLPPT